jgi:hypothetical protein
LQEDTLRLRRALYDKDHELIACNPFYIDGHLDYVQLLKKNSYFFSFLHNKLSSVLQRIRLLGLKDYLLCHLKGKRTKVAIRQRGDLKNIELDRYFMFRENKDMKIIRYYWENSVIWLNKIEEYLQRRGIKFILVAYPYGIQVSPTAWEGGRVMWQFGKNKLYDSPAPFEMFYEYSKKRGVKFINLWPYLLQHAKEDLYFNWDGHWTVLGHKRVAEGIFNNPLFKQAVNQE